MVAPSKNKTLKLTKVLSESDVYFTSFFEAGGTEIPPGPSHLFGARWDRFSCGAFKFMTPWHLFYELTGYPVGPIVRKGPHISKFCTTARRALPALSGAHLAAFGCCRGLRLHSASFNFEVES
jgi:hypothetical protein